MGNTVSTDNTAKPQDAGVAVAPDSGKVKGTGKGLQNLQRFGRSLMLPIAALPAAALLLRLGQDDLLGRFESLTTAAQVIGAAGGALFENLPLLFAIGIAFGFARKGDGSTALAAAVGYLVMINVFEVMAPLVLGAAPEGGEEPVINYGVLAGIIIGLTTALLWQRFHRTKLPDWLGFFAGRRLVPILTALAGIVIGVVMALIYPVFDRGLNSVGNAVAENTVIGSGVYGTLNRLLIPLGLHHILNSIVWFIIGDYEGTNGDLNRFFAGDPSAGVFMTGFFPIMMFALPAAALAIWQEARPSQRKIVGGVMLSTGLTAFLTGITEPLEFSFMFVAWPLYVVHAILTGTSFLVVNLLGIHHGFGFSAGAIDYLLNFGIAEKPLWLIPIGLIYAAIYYVLFRFVIRRWNLRTLGREDETEGTPSMATPDAS
ncbi:PTS N-acetylglucosamine transporter subunit IIBC [Cryobacterium suzukii]|uniref:PTS N-acetylglucosamine transporter subunit IIBC n=1 Tax=Cryobacterium suzukii TaxID=1259198 RepID=A0A4R9AEP5_9MICO|nr:PTS transporter subunit EIIC [Cryobacterium suzukii]TFD59789.1 PTS N-acetylglucosamine transporter subunit IIBC [Cryobacterium suzukii]